MSLAHTNIVSGDGCKLKNGRAICQTYIYGQRIDVSLRRNKYSSVQGFVVLGIEVPSLLGMDYLTKFLLNFSLGKYVSMKVTSKPKRRILLEMQFEAERFLLKKSLEKGMEIAANKLLQYIQCIFYRMGIGCKFEDEDK